MGYFLVTVCGLIAVVSLVAEHGLSGRQVSVVAACGLSSCSSQAVEHTGSIVVVHRLSCPMECGVFPDQGSNLCLLHWQTECSQLSHKGSLGVE